MEEATFLAGFNFKPHLAGAIGIEREYFLTSPTDWSQPIPRSPDFLDRVCDPAWTFELSACQVEHRTTPERSLKAIAYQLDAGYQQGSRVASSLGLKLSVLEVAHENMPLNVYPHNERYRSLEARLPKEVLRAACRVTGTHIHFGVRDMEEAIDIHNVMVRDLNDFIAMGDHSAGMRMLLYRQMAKNWKPPFYESPSHFHAVACEQGFEENPRDCWHLVRITRHGTVELRMFGMTDSAEEIVSWIRAIQHRITTR